MGVARCCGRLFIGMFQGEIDRLKVEGTMNVKNLLQCDATLRIAVNEDLQICRPGEVRGGEERLVFDF